MADHPKLTFSTLTGAPTSGLTVLGDALLADGQQDQAIAAYGSALELVPGDAHAASKKAALHIKRGQLAEVKRLESSISDSARFGAVSALVRLAGNDGALLPSIGSMHGDAMSWVADVPV